MKNKYFKLLVLILAVAVVVPTIVSAAWWNPFSWGVWNRIFHFQRTEQQQVQQTPGVCTQDAKQCPDGSYVSRQGPKCEFAACPEAKKDKTTDWKTYTNSEYGFELKYPTDWGFIENQGNPVFYPNVYKNEAVSCYGGNSFGDCWAHTISIVIQPYNKVESYWLWEVIGNKPMNIKPPLKTAYDEDFYKNSYYVGAKKIFTFVSRDQNIAPWQSNYSVIDSPEKQSLVIFHGENDKNPISIMNVLEETVSTFKFTNAQPVVGGDRDSHGCIGSAGYTWCEAKKKCLRSWEEKCEINQVDGNGIRTGKITIDYNAANELQQSVNNGNQPWRLVAEDVIKVDAGSHGFINSDFVGLKKISYSASAGVETYELTHQNITYIITVIKPVPGDGKIWIVSDIEQK